ncbi:hypothetical protein VTN77DRAFT_5780 [Rasamsonia byssochlamydoides]|uniref:uncharacterized protein n=1 Tax=Rasamsonia byssochlamydoides TaxID=89139 RepID=UPI003743D08B
MAPARRSGRLDGARPKYTNDPFEAAGLSADSASEDNISDRPRKRKGKGRKRQEDSSDEDFAEAGLENLEEIPDDDEDAAGIDDESEVFEDDEESLNEETASVMKTRYSKKRRPDGTVAFHREETHNRGIWNPMEHVSKSMHLKLTFGTDDRDLLATIYGRDRWFRGIDAALPSRTSLDEIESMADYGPGKTFGVAGEDMEMEATTGWDWYYDDNSGGRFRKRQRIERIDEDEARQRYLPQPHKTEHTVIIGPVDNQKVFHLHQNECLDFGEAWSETKPRKKKGRKRRDEDPEEALPSAEAKDEPSEEHPVDQKRPREGWILNMGNKVQCLAWAPNQDGVTQYLAIAVPITEQQKSEQPFEGKPSGTPAFTPSEPYPSALQIWSFEASKDEGLTRTLDMSCKPKLRMVICTDWGDIRRIAWCPMARSRRDEDDEDGSHSLGLLAGVWGDGAVRVIDIKLGSASDTPEFYRLQSPAFSCKPPSTVSSCVTWLSPSDIAVGCANGFVAIWNLASSCQTEPVPDAPSPYLYFPVHSTYITGIASAYPQHPHLLGTTSMDGQTRLTSILDPQKDVVDTSRMRLGSMHICYSPFLQAFLSNDENDFIRSLAVRRFYTTTTVGRMPSTVTALAPSSVWHPSGLIGCTGGSVIALNPLRRLLHTKERHWHLTWFTHEWTRGAQAGSPNVSRFLDGFRAESVSLLRTMMGDRRIVNGVMAITIFDDENHITALSWNPNQRCAGWASAGMGSGLVRVEDLAI